MVREQRRVAYIRSIPEWYGHNVNDIFFRETDWLFVPVQDLSPAERLAEYQKASYFFVSGHGHPSEAASALAAGCILVGLRADLDPKARMVACASLNPIDSVTALKVVEYFRRKLAYIPFFLVPTIVKMASPFMKIKTLVSAAIKTYRKQGLKPVIVKTKNYFYKVWGFKNV